jgi:hypothetical protein
MLTEFKPDVKRELVETLERGIFAIRDGRIGCAEDLGFIAKALVVTLESFLVDFTDDTGFINEGFAYAIGGSSVNQELMEFLLTNDEDTAAKLRATAAMDKIMKQEDLRKILSNYGIVVNPSIDIKSDEAKAAISKSYKQMKQRNKNFPNYKMAVVGCLHGLGLDTVDLVKMEILKEA